MSSSEPAIVLLNPAAGRGRAGDLRRPMAQWLLRHAPGVPLLVPQSVDTALATLMITANRTRVVLVGGDGTVQSMLPAFLRCGHRLAVVPAGERNTLAQALGVAHVGWQQALAYALKGRTAPVDVAQVHTEAFTAPFVSSLALGWEAAAALQAAALPAWWPPSVRRWTSALVASRSSPAVQARVWIDAQLRHEGTLQSARLRNIPAGTVTARHAAAAEVPTAVEGRLNDGRLAAELLDNASTWRWAARQTHGAAPLQRWSAQHIRIEAGQPVALVTDGEWHPAVSRITVQVLPRAVYAVGLHDLPPRQPPGGH